MTVSTYLRFGRIDLSWLPSLNLVAVSCYLLDRTKGGNKKKKSGVAMKTGRSLTNYSYRHDRLDLRKLYFLTGN